MLFTSALRSQIHCTLISQQTFLTRHGHLSTGFIINRKKQTITVLFTNGRSLMEFNHYWLLHLHVRFCYSDMWKWSDTICLVCGMLTHYERQHPTVAEKVCSHSENFINPHTRSSIDWISSLSLPLSNSFSFFFCFAVILLALWSRTGSGPRTSPQRHNYHTWAKCASHKLQYPSKAFRAYSKPLLLWFSQSVLSPLTVCFIHSPCLFGFLPPSQCPALLSVTLSLHHYKWNDTVEAVQRMLLVAYC